MMLTVGCVFPSRQKQEKSIFPHKKAQNNFCVLLLLNSATMNIAFFFRPFVFTCIGLVFVSVLFTNTVRFGKRNVAFCRTASQFSCQRPNRLLIWGVNKIQTDAQNEKKEEKKEGMRIFKNSVRGMCVCMCHFGQHVIGKAWCLPSLVKVETPCPPPAVLVQTGEE